MTDKTPAAPADQINETAATEETTMTDDKTGAAEAQAHATDTRSQPGPSNQKTASAKPEAPDTEAVATRAREAERDRVSTIYDLAGRLNLERSFAEDLVKRGISVDEARRLILDQVATKSDETRTFGQVSIPLGGRRAHHPSRRGGQRAAAPLQPDAVPPRGCRAPVSRHDAPGTRPRSLGNAGVNTRGLSRDEVATRALHSTSDFPEILSAVTNKTLRQAYEAYPRTFMLFCRQVLATDFKAMHRVQLGEAPQLLEVGESGEAARSARARRATRSRPTAGWSRSPARC